MVMVNSGTQFGKVIIKVVRTAHAGCAQGAHSLNTPSAALNSLV